MIVSSEERSHPFYFIVSSGQDTLTSIGNGGIAMFSSVCIISQEFCSMVNFLTFLLFQ